MFGAAILKLSDMSLVCVGVNRGTESPLWHAEVSPLRALEVMYPSALYQKPLLQADSLGDSEHSTRRRTHYIPRATSFRH